MWKKDVEKVFVNSEMAAPPQWLTWMLRTSSNLRFDRRSDTFNFEGLNGTPELSWIPQTPIAIHPEDIT